MVKLRQKIQKKEEVVEEGQPRRDKSFFGFVRKILRGLGSVLLNEVMPIDELLNMVRPVIYVFLVYKQSFKKKKSNIAIKVSLLIDLIQIAFSAIRVWRSNKAKNAPKKAGVSQCPRLLTDVEKSELKSRSIFSLLKYLLREPVY